MDVRQIRYFVAASRGGSLSAAARELGVSVQAASKAIAELEREVGQPIFSRSDRGVSPTPFGMGLLARAEVFMDAFAELESYAKDPDAADAASVARLGADASLRIGVCVPSLEGIDRFLPRFEETIRKAVGVPVGLRTMSTVKGLAGLREGELDCMVTIGSVSEEGLDCVSLGGLRAGVFVAATKPVAKLESVSIEQLSEHPVLWSDDFDVAAGSLLNTFREHGLTSELLHPANDEERAEGLFEKGAFFFSAYVPMLRQYDENLVLVPLCEKGAVTVPLCLVSASGKKSPAYRVFERLACDNLAGLLKG